MRIRREEPNGPGCGECFNAQAAFQLRTGDIERPVAVPRLRRKAETAARSYANQRFYESPRRRSETFAECNAYRTRAGIRLGCAVASFEEEFQGYLVFVARGRTLRLLRVSSLGRDGQLALRCEALRLPRQVGCG